MSLKKGKEFRMRTRLIFITVSCWGMETDNRKSIA